MSTVRIPVENFERARETLQFTTFKRPFAAVVVRLELDGLQVTFVAYTQRLVPAYCPGKEGNWQFVANRGTFTHYKVDLDGGLHLTGKGSRKVSWEGDHMVTSYSLIRRKILRAFRTPTQEELDELGKVAPTDSQFNC